MPTSDWSSHVWPRAAAIESAATEQECWTLYALAEKVRIAVEIGVHKGRTAFCIGHGLPAYGHLFAIDTWATETRDVTGDHYNAGPFFAEAGRNVSGLPVRLVKANSLEVAAAWRVPIDLLFIDGNHAEEAVQADWDAWSPFLHDGSVVAWHDATYDKPFGVRPVVARLIASGQLRMRATVDTLAVTVPGSAEPDG